MRAPRIAGPTAALAVALTLQVGCNGSPPPDVPEGSAEPVPTPAADTRSRTQEPLLCLNCHGVPPSSGAHVAHADLDGYQRGFDCSLCHFVQRFPDRHDDGTVDVRFSPVLAGAEGARYRRQTCTGVACHSDARGDSRPVAWTADVDLGCDGCHDSRSSAAIEMSGRHAFHLNSGAACSECHGGVVDRSGAIVDFARHVDGRVDVAVLAGDYEPLSGACTPGCHVTRNWRDGPG